MSGTIIASDGNRLPISELPMAIGYVGDNATTMTVQYPFVSVDANGVQTTTTRTYVQTLTYTGDLLTNVSRWTYTP